MRRWIALSFDDTADARVFDISLDARIPPREMDLSGLPLFQGKTPADPDHPTDITFQGVTLPGDAPEIGPL